MTMYGQPANANWEQHVRPYETLRQARRRRQTGQIVADPSPLALELLRRPRRTPEPAPRPRMTDGFHRAEQAIVTQEALLAAPG